MSWWDRSVRPKLDPLHPAAHNSEEEVKGRSPEEVQLTEGDEARGVGVDLLEQFGHVDVGHAQRRAQQSRELLAGDSLVVVHVKQLRGGEREARRGRVGEVKGYREDRTLWAAQCLHTARKPSHWVKLTLSKR